MVGRVWAGLTAYTNTKQKINSPGLGRTARQSPGQGRTARGSPGQGRTVRGSPGQGRTARGSPGQGRTGSGVDVVMFESLGRHVYFSDRRNTQLL